MDEIRIPLREVPAIRRESEPVRPAESATTAVRPASDTNRIAVWLRRIAKAVILAAAFLAPLLYLSVTQDVLYIKVVLVEAVAAVAVALWLIAALLAKRLSYLRSPLNAVFLGIAVVLVAATVLSKNPWGSFWGPDPTGEKAASVLAFLALSFLAQALFSRRDAARATGALLASFGLLSVFVLGSILWTRAGGTLPPWLNVNPVGTVNALSLVIAVGFLLAFGLLLSRLAPGGRGLIGPWIGRASLTVAVLTFITLLFIGFRQAWIGVAAALALMLAFRFMRSSGASTPTPGEGKEQAFGVPVLAVMLAALAASVFLAYRPAPFAASVFQPPLEISPRFRASLGMGAKAIAEEPLLGYGPAQFRVVFHRFRDAADNQNPLWAIRFNHGYSFFSTIPATMGVLGTIVFLVFPFVALTLILRGIARPEGRNPYLLGLGVSAFFAMLMWFLYAGNFTASFFLFLFLGFALVFIAEREDAPAPAPGAALPGEDSLRRWAAGGRSRFGALWPPFRARRRDIPLVASGAIFIVSLAAVFAAIFSLVALWALGSQYAAEIYVRRAAEVLNLYGNVDSAKAFLDRAIRLNPSADSYHQGRAQAALIAIQRLIVQAAANPGRDYLAEFRADFAAGQAAGQRATELAPEEPENWASLGELYETVLPFDPAALEAALGAYERAREFDPTSPIRPFLEGRVRLAQADFLQAQAGAAPPGDDQKRLFEARALELDEARKALEASLALKPDYAQAHFLLAQAAIRENNLAGAIRSIEETARLAPGDIGVAFQLGVLYYSAGRLDEAKAEFNRAVAIDDNYSNARYFLGLIWDRMGDRDAALSQFQKIARLNPDNDEIKRIIENLESGKPALDGIVPPAPAPEARKDAPVKEDEERQPLQPGRRR